VKAAAHFAQFCLSLTQSDDRWEGEPLRLEPWQKKMMGEALAENAEGLPLWKTVAILIPRKNGKSLLLAAVALWHLVYDEGRPEILLAASSDKQAGRLFDACARFVRQSAALSEVLRVRENEGEIRREDGRGAIIRVSSDPRRLMGYGPSLVVVDELAQFTTPTLERAFGALASGGLARTSPRLFIISTAGEASQRHDSILGTLLDAGLDAEGVDRSRPGLTVCRLPESKTLIWSYEAETDDPGDVKGMKKGNPASWVTLDDLRREAASAKLTTAEKLQLYGNRWAAGNSTWISPSEWDACVDRERVIEQGEPIILSFDGSSRRDSTVLCATTLDGFTCLVEAWENDGAKSWRVPRIEVLDVIERMMNGHEVVEFCFDPWEWRTESDEWQRTWGERALEFPTNSRQRFGPACDRFRQAVLERVLRHDGSELLARHVGHCVAKTSPFGTVIQKTYPDSPRRIDAAVAMVLGYERAVWHANNEQVRPVVMVASV
jgi:phage terminase large subunit-like protein